MTKIAASSLKSIADRAQYFKDAGNIENAINGLIDDGLTLSLSEALILGLLRQGVSKYLAIFGHGSTSFGEMLRIYEEAELISCTQYRNEVEMAHAATALKWVYDETPAVVTSIGPGALQAMSGALAAASNQIGLYHIYGDETTYGEGANMQQLPGGGQGQFGQMTALMGGSYTLHTPNAIRDALRNGAMAVFNPIKPKPFFVNFPLNTQCSEITLYLNQLPQKPMTQKLAPSEDGIYDKAIELIKSASKLAIKAGGGTRSMSANLTKFTEKSGALLVQSPGSLGVLPNDHQHNMHVGGSKGSISGNFAMSEAETLIVIGSRAVCQSDCSGMGWPKVQKVININADLLDAHHYNHTTALVGDGNVILEKLIAKLDQAGDVSTNKSEWLAAGFEAKKEWQAHRKERCENTGIMDPVFGRELLSQPAAISIAANFCKENGDVKYFDAGDIQANGFQVVEDDQPFETFTETGASYMGFAVSALLSGGIADQPKYAAAFTGDGSFMMNPQVLIDGVEHGVNGTIILFDNRRMAAISGLQMAQYGIDYKTNDQVAVDYVQMANSVSGVEAYFGGYDKESLTEALQKARDYQGLSLVHVPVYYGEDELAGMGAYGNWNVGNWCDDVQDKYLKNTI